MKQIYQKGEIITLLTLATIILLGAVSIGSVYILKNKQAVPPLKSRAQVVSTPASQPPPPTPTNFPGCQSDWGCKVNNIEGDPPECAGQSDKITYFNKARELSFGPPEIYGPGWENRFWQKAKEMWYKSIENGLGLKDKGYSGCCSRGDCYKDLGEVTTSTPTLTIEQKNQLPTPTVLPTPGLDIAILNEKCDGYPAGYCIGSSIPNWSRFMYCDGEFWTNYHKSGIENEDYKCENAFSYPCIATYYPKLANYQCCPSSISLSEGPKPVCSIPWVSSAPKPPDAELPPKSFNLISPANNTSTDQKTVTFIWEDTKSQYGYILIVRNFTSPKTSLPLGVTYYIPQGTNSWTVRNDELATALKTNKVEWEVLEADSSYDKKLYASVRNNKRSDFWILNIPGPTPAPEKLSIVGSIQATFQDHNSFDDITVRIFRLENGIRKNQVGEPAIFFSNKIFGGYQEFNFTDLANGDYEVVAEVHKDNKQIELQDYKVDCWSNKERKHLEDKSKCLLAEFGGRVTFYFTIPNVISPSSTIPTSSRRKDNTPE